MVNSYKIALVTLSSEGLEIARKISLKVPSRIFVHSLVAQADDYVVFDRVVELTGEIFQSYKKIVYILPVGVAVRALAPYIQHKTIDPAVVAIDMKARWAISLLSGHEGGANDLCLKVSNILGSEPIVTTATEARKDIIVGIGCRRGADSRDIVQAVIRTLEKVEIDLDRVRMLASADIKKDEQGLIQAGQELGIPLYFIPGKQILSLPLNVTESEFVRESVGLPGVAEPCALLAGRNTKLILGKTICKSVTIAIAREDLL
ncbi:MAG: cobalamin biosynthesis protein CbiG [Desulfonatronovibrio sp. MSAO_Bac4]|nr:MAG: cobalamin biosynthesis protein CbiG [Desulfonatronovibrio sp. MSAO_Bac4]